MAELKNTIVNGNLNIINNSDIPVLNTTDVYFNDKSITNHFNNTFIHIKLIKYLTDNGRFVFLGVPYALDMLGDGIELKYLRFSKTGKSNIQKRITRRGWHTLRNMSRTYNYISTWNHTRELVQLTLDYDGGQNCPTINFYSNGVIIQYGFAQHTSDYKNLVTLPIAYTNPFYSIVATHFNELNTNSQGVLWRERTLTTFLLVCTTKIQENSWITIG